MKTAPLIALSLSLIIALLSFSSYTTASVLLSNDQYEFLFLRFVQQYNKNYETNGFFTKYSTFKNNLDYIIAHNQRNDVTYTLAMNEYGDLSTAEFNKLMGLTPYHQKNNMAYVHGQNLADATRNNSLGDVQAIDWREKGVVAPVKNQGQCGSCWAHSATSAVESASAIKTGKLQELSVQQVIDCDTNSSGCEGGLPSLAFEYLLQAGGQCLASDYQQTPGQGKCHDTDCKKVVSLTGYKTIPVGDASHIQLLQQQPLSVAIAASSRSFQFYSSGIITSCDDDVNINHAINLVGYGVKKGANGDDTAYYIGLNHWGQSWGNNGSFNIAVGHNLCGIASSTLDVYPTV